RHDERARVPARALRRGLFVLHPPATRRRRQRRVRPARAPRRETQSEGPARVRIRRAAFLVAALVGGAADARAEDSPSAAAPAREEPFATKPGYLQVFGTVMGGTGLRFNNPYRLATPLGSDAESVSRTAAYVDLGLGATFGSPLGFQHGAALRLTT